MNKIFFLLLAFIIITGKSYGQCFPDRHNTTWFEAWISCTKSENPNPDRGVSHWIMYDLAHQYELGQVHLWNSNDPKNLDRGVKELIVDYSTDGENWTEQGTYNIEMANGKSTYEGLDGPNFDGTEARYLLLTAKSSHGDDCAGFSEIRIQVHGVNATDENFLATTMKVNVFPNPFAISFKAEIQTEKHEQIDYSLIDMYGRKVKYGKIERLLETNIINITASGLQNGVYYLVVRQGENSIRQAVVKVE